MGNRSARAAAPFTLVLAILLAVAGCGGSRGGAARPSLPTGRAAVPILIAEADSAIARSDANAARRALDQALEAAPDSASVHLARARFFVAIRRYKDAKTELDRAAVLAPRSPEPPYQLGRAYQAAGEIAAARAAFSRALALDPAHAPSREALSGLLGSKYEAAGIPGDYPKLGGRPTISRGELGVILAVELGVDPDRTTWRSGEAQRTNWVELDQAWGARWLRASMMRRWIPPYPDGSYHLDDPVTRGQLALVLARIETERPRKAAGADTVFADIGPRHFLGRAASRAWRLGLPTRSGRFDPSAVATGDDAFRAVRGLARAWGASPVVEGDSAGR